METNESKIDLSSIGKSTRPRKKSAKVQSIDGEVPVTDAMIEAYENEATQERLKRLENLPAYLRAAHNAIREPETKRIYCVMTPVMLGNNTVADLFLSFLFTTINKVNKITEKETDISIIKKHKVSGLSNAFVSLKNAFDYMYGREIKGESSNPLNRLADMGDTFSINEMITLIFSVMSEVYHIYPDDFVIVYPKSIDNGRKDYTTAVKEDGMTSSWDKQTVSTGIMRNYFSFIETQTYMINPPVLSTNGYIFTEDDE